MPLATDGHCDNGKQGLYGDVQVESNGVWFSDGLDEIQVTATILYKGKKYILSEVIPYEDVQLQEQGFVGSRVSLKELSDEWYRNPETGEALKK